jgi:hypothetical protein
VPVIVIAQPDQTAQRKRPNFAISRPTTMLEGTKAPVSGIMARPVMVGLKSLTISRQNGI